MPRPIPKVRPLWRSVCAGGTGGEKGSITVFSLMMLISMIGIGGLAVNTMYFETKRMELQDAADRCALMAAIAQNRIDGGATTDLTAEQVANDCMAKSTVGAVGMGAPAVSTQNSERSVTLTGAYGFAPVFANISGAFSANFNVTARAHQKLPNLEISVVMDVSHFNNVRDIKAPLKTFLNTIAAPDTGNKVSVNIIPFTDNVHLGTVLAETFNDTNKPAIDNTDRRACLVVPASARSTLDLDQTHALPWSWPIHLNNPPASHTVETQHITYVAATERAQQSTNTTGNCHRQNTLAVGVNAPLVGAQVARPISATATTALNTKIDGLWGGASQNTTSTSTSNSALGMKWALAFMDESTRNIITAQVSAGTSPAPVQGRPLSYDAQDVLKVIIFIPNNVFMLDSDANGREMRPEYITPELAPIWRTPGNGTTSQPVRYSIFHPDAPGPNKYWVTRGQNTAAPQEQAHWAAAPYAHPSGGAAVQQTWQDIWNNMTLSYAIRQLYMAPMAPVSPDYHWQAMIDRFTYLATTSDNARAEFAELCEKAKDEDVLIYSILGSGTANVTGAQATNFAAHNLAAPSARTLYQNCATSPAHAFTVNLSQAQMRSILRVIASNIAQLTLTQ